MNNSKYHLLTRQSPIAERAEIYVLCNWLLVLLFLQLVYVSLLCRRFFGHRHNVHCLRPILWINTVPWIFMPQLSVRRSRFYFQHVQPIQPCYRTLFGYSTALNFKIFICWKLNRLLLNHMYLFTKFDTNACNSINLTTRTIRVSLDHGLSFSGFFSLFRTLHAFAKSSFRMPEQSLPAHVFTFRDIVKHIALDRV